MLTLHAIITIHPKIHLQEHACQCCGKKIKDMDLNDCYTHELSHWLYLNDKPKDTLKTCKVTELPSDKPS